MVDSTQFFRALDKYERLGEDGVLGLLTSGRKDASGDFTPGCGLSDAHAGCVIEFLKCADSSQSNDETLFRMRRWFAIMHMPQEQLDELHGALDKAGLV